MFSEIFSIGQTTSAFGIDQDGSTVNFTLPSIDSRAVAIERMLPGDELVCLEGNQLMTYHTVSAHPLAMARNQMTWTKNVVVKRKRRIKNPSSYWREIKSHMPSGSEIRIQRLGSGDYDFLTEVTHQDGKKTFIPGLPWSGIERFGESE